MTNMTNRLADSAARRPIARFHGPFQAAVRLPGSKSIALRHILMSLLADTPTRLDGVPRCDDVDAMFDAATGLGAAVTRRGESAILEPPATAPAAPVELDLGMSGVSLRLMLAHAALRPTPTRFTGHPQLRRRPCADLVSALAGLGCRIRAAPGGYLPITVVGPAAPAASTTLRTAVTSQYLSALLLIAPALPNGLTIHLLGQRTSASYVGLTECEMARRGAEVRALDATTLHVPPATIAGGRIAIEGDASAATYHAALATLHGGTVTFTNLGGATKQGDYAFLALCERAGATVRRAPSAVTVTGPRRLRAIDHADMRDMPDAAPTLMALAPFLPTATRITGLATLRVKECDRLSAGATELRRAGVSVDRGEDAMTIHPAKALRPAAFHTYEDHRMAMALSVLASGIGDCEVLGADCVTKTYADYWDDFDRLRSAAANADGP